MDWRVMPVLAFPKKRELFSNSPDWREGHPVFHGISGRKAGISIPELPDGSASEPFGKKKDTRMDVPNIFSSYFDFASF